MKRHICVSHEAGKTVNMLEANHIFEWGSKFTNTAPLLM
jgi:hypothetical protein